MKAKGIRRVVACVGLLSLGLTAIGATAQAVVSTTPAQSLTVANKMYDTEKELARMVKRYGLTEEQKAKVRPLLLEQQKRVHALGEDESLSNSAWAADVWKVHLQTVAQVKLQMTDAQLSKYVKDEAKRSKSDGSNDNADDGPPDGPPPGPPPGGGGPGGGPGGGGPPGE